MTPHRPTCRVFPLSKADGPANMALDEALLDLVADDPGSAALRTYLWTEATLSVGYFQAFADVEADPRWRSLPVVRRPTGGGALLHDREITYALAVPRDHPLSRRTGDLYRVVHAAIAGMLTAQGLPSSRRGPIPEADRGPKPFLCFADRDAEDVVSGRFKLVGSAQRRRSGAVLQHGSLLLARSPFTPELPGVSDLAPVDPDWSDRLDRAIPEALGLQAVPTPWTDPLLARARALESAVYRNDTWTRRR